MNVEYWISKYICLVLELMTSNRFCCMNTAELIHEYFITISYSMYNE